MITKLNNADFYKKATEYLIVKLTELDLTVKNLKYHDTYFISYRGPNTIVQFQINEIPNFVFGIWWNTTFDHTQVGPLYGYLFAKQTPNLNEFSPLHAVFKEDLLITFSKVGQVTAMTGDLSFITTMKKFPEWAWYCDHYAHDPHNLEISQATAKKKYNDYLASIQKTNEFKQKYDSEYMNQFYTILKHYFNPVWIVENGETIYPQYEAITLSTKSRDPLIDILSDGDQEKLITLRSKIETLAQKQHIYWACPIATTITYIKNKSWLNKKKLWNM